MPSLEERVSALEARVEELATESQHATDIAVVAAREALTAREAHQKNIELLNALRKTQAEHTKSFSEHSEILNRHDQRLDSIDGKLGQLTVGVHSIETLLRHLVDEGDTNPSDGN